MNKDMLVIAHRGASGYAPENTLAAMQTALDLNVSAIELDVHNVAGELVVFHDRRLEGKSDGQGLIHLTSTASLADISVKGEPIPTLWQVLTLIAGRCTVNIELKGIQTLTPFLALYPKAISILGYREDQLLISSFNHPYLAEVKQVFPKAYVAPLLASIPLDLADVASKLQAYSINLDINFVNRAIINDAHRRDVKVFVYTVDNPDDVRALAAIGVDGVFSNYPDRVSSALLQATTEDYQDWFE